jgi:hypothetical protein
VLKGLRSNVLKPMTLTKLMLVQSSLSLPELVALKPTMGMAVEFSLMYWLGVTRCAVVPVVTVALASSVTASIANAEIMSTKSVTTLNERTYKMEYFDIFLSHLNLILPSSIETWG